MKLTALMISPTAAYLTISDNGGSGRRTACRLGDRQVGLLLFSGR
jgi:hypothetical protein